jgi:hypothetical protein
MDWGNLRKITGVKKICLKKNPPASGDVESDPPRWSKNCQKGAKGIRRKLVYLLGVTPLSWGKKGDWMLRGFPTWLGRRLDTSPASHNDPLKLELLGTWAPPKSSRPSSNGEGETAHFCLFDGND